MAEQTLFIAWRGENRLWFPVGRLDADAGGPCYRFRYIGGAERAQKEAGFAPLVEFPELEKDYQSVELFPLFQNRLMSPHRPDFASYLKTLDLEGNADPIEVLSVTGGRRNTDPFEVFPKIVKQPNGNFICKFFLHGWRHVSQCAMKRLDQLQAGEELRLALELNNPRTGLAVQIQTTDYQIIGWAPRYLVNDIARTRPDTSGKYETKVVRLNPQPAPSRQRLLVELRGNWVRHEPMTGEDYRPLVD